MDKCCVCGIRGSHKSVSKEKLTTIPEYHEKWGRKICWKCEKTHLVKVGIVKIFCIKMFW